MLEQRCIYALSVLSVFLSLLSWLEFQRGAGRERPGQTPGEGNLGMTAKSAGPLCMFVCIMCVFIESLPMDVFAFTLHLSLSLSLSLSVISLHLFSRPPPQTFFFQLPLSPLVSFVPPNTAFSILPLIATQQNGSAASPTSENLSTFCGCKLCFSFFVSFLFWKSLCKVLLLIHLHFFLPY